MSVNYEQIKKYQPKIIKHMQQYAEIGLPIFPVCPPEHYSMSRTHREKCNCAGKLLLSALRSGIDNVIFFLLYSFKPSGSCVNCTS